MHVIAGYVDLLAQTDLTHEQQEYIAALRSGCASIRLITSDVLDFAKLQNPNAESRARSAEIDLRKIATEIVHGCSSSTYMSSVRNTPYQGGSSGAADRPDIILEIDKEVPQTVFLDEVYVTRILMNLLNNALKFCSEGFILIRISLSDINGDGNRSLCISVRDTGIGIAKSFRLSNIFSPFQQADTSLTRKHTGTGLGLAICYQLATSMHGNMGIWSQQGEGAGTELTVYLPVDLSTHTPDDGTDRRRPPVHLEQPLSSCRSMRHLASTVRVGFLTRSSRKQRMLLEAFTAYGYQVEDLLNSSVSGASLDRAWIDVEVLPTHSDKVRRLLGIPSLQVFVLCENAGTSSRDPLILSMLQNARANVILMSRPVNIPDAAEWLFNTQVALNNGGRALDVIRGTSAPSQSSDVYSPGPAPSRPLGTTPEDEQTVNGMLNGGTQLRILLVDDNLVSTAWRGSRGRA